MMCEINKNNNKPSVNNPMGQILENNFITLLKSIYIIVLLYGLYIYLFSAILRETSIFHYKCSISVFI